MIVRLFGVNVTMSIMDHRSDLQTFPALGDRGGEAPLRRETRMDGCFLNVVGVPVPLISRSKSEYANRITYQYNIRADKSW